MPCACRAPQEPVAGQGRRRRRPHGLFADGCAGARAPEPGARGGVLRHRLRDDDAIDGADGAAGRARRNPQLLGLLQSHHHRADDQGDPRQSRSASRWLSRSRPRLDGDRHRPYEFIARFYKKPMVVAGFEPLDVLQSIWMVLKQIKEGRCEIENQYARIVPEAGQCPPRCAPLRASMNCANSSSGADSARSTIPA